MSNLLARRLDFGGDMASTAQDPQAPLRGNGEGKKEEERDEDSACPSRLSAGGAARISTRTALSLPSGHGAMRTKTARPPAKAIFPAEPIGHRAG